MTERILSQASSWSFLCERDREGNWQILPHQKTERWFLQQVGDKWLLVVGNVPQVNLHPPEAMSFLERRRKRCKTLEAV